MTKNMRRWIPGVVAGLLCLAGSMAWAEGDASAASAAPAAAAPILTPPPPAQPRINGPRVFGVRPGSPLMLGCDMSKLDDFTMGLLTNDEVLELDQDPLGKQATRVAAAGEHEVWAKDMADGSKAVGLFNRGQAPATVTAEWSALAVKGPRKARDLWRQKDLGAFDGKYEATVPSHGVLLLRLWPEK